MRRVFGLLLFISYASYGQTIDSVDFDLNKLNGIDFFKKYSFFGESISKDDIEVTKLIWSTRQMRDISNSLKEKGISTLTRIDERPSNQNSYYIIGHYQLAVDHFARMSYYRVGLKHKTIEYQGLSDFANSTWVRVK